MEGKATLVHIMKATRGQ